MSLTDEDVSNFDEIVEQLSKRSDDLSPETKSSDTQDKNESTEPSDTDQGKKPKRQGKGSKSYDFYSVIVPMFSCDDFRANFRMSRSCFASIMEKLTAKVKIYNMEKKLLFTVQMLSTRESFCAVGARFGLAKGAAYQYFCEIIDGLITMFKEHVYWPDESELSHIEQGFKPKTGGYVPGIVGAIESCHIQIKKPARYSIYCNSRNTHSIILQAVCDHQKIFTDIYVGAPGCLQAERVFRNSPLSKEIERLIPEDYHIVGNTCYPPMKNLVVPFAEDSFLTETQLHFNDCLLKATDTINTALRLLLARFRRLTYLDTSKPELANKMVCCCVILHNHILMHDEVDDTEELLQQDVDLFVNTESEQPMEPDADADADEDTRGIMKRNYLLSLFDFI